MIYRCRACQCEDARGCLPSASCGLYLMLLWCLSVGCVLGAVHTLRAVAREQAALVEIAGPVDAPWWFGVVAVVSGALALVTVAVGMWVVKFALESAEWLVFARRRCPACGARRWLWGFTQGYGL